MMVFALTEKCLSSDKESLVHATLVIKTQWLLHASMQVVGQKSLGDTKPSQKTETSV